MDLFFGKTVYSHDLQSRKTTFETLTKLKSLTNPRRMGVTSKDYLKLEKAEKQKLKNGTFLVASTFTKPLRDYKHAKDINFLVLDIENAQFDFNPKDFPYNFIFHSTSSHMPNDERYHLFIECDKSITPKNYSKAVLTLANMINLSFITPETFRYVQPMFLPKPLDDVEYVYKTGLNRQVFTEKQIDDSELPRKDVLGYISKHTAATHKSALLNIKPILLNITPEYVAKLLEHLDPDMDREEWIRVAAGIRHQYREDPETGYELFDDWSQKGSKYEGAQDTYNTFFSFRASPVDRQPCTIRSIITMAEDQGFDEPAPMEEQPADLAADIEKKEKWSDGFVFMSESNEFYDVQTGHSFKVESLNNCCSRYMLSPLDLEKGKSKPNTKPSDHLLNILRIPVVRYHAYKPTKDKNPIVTVEGVPYVNTYKCPTHYYENIKKLSDGEERQYEFVKSVLYEHLDMLFPNKLEQKILLSFLAYTVQEIGKKIRWSIIMQGAEGSGKTFFLKMMEIIHGVSNVKPIGIQSLESGYNGWMSDTQLVFIEEMRSSGKDRFRATDKLKNFLSDDRLSINEKWERVRTVDNICNIVINSNWTDCVAVGGTNRRYTMLISAIQTKEQLAKISPDYYERLYSILQFPKLLYKFLKEYPIPYPPQPDNKFEFRANGRAPENESDKTILALSRNDLEDWIEDTLDLDEHMLNKTLLSSTLLRNRVNNDTEMPDTFNDRQIRKALENLGFLYEGRKTVNKQKLRFWRHANTNKDTFEQELNKMRK